MSNPTSLALRDNKGKPELSQVDPILMEEVARVLEFGAKKYARNNWRKGQPVTKLWDSAMRHMAAILRGEDIDPESGCKHWAHVCCNMMFLGCQEGRDDLDDRYKKKKGEEKKTVIREQVGGEVGGKVVDKKEGDDFLTCLRNSQRLQSMGVDEKKARLVMFLSQQGDEIEVRNEVGERVGNPFTGRKLPEGWEEAQEKSRMEREEIMSDVFRQMREEEEYPPKGRHFVLQEEEEEDLDSQNPRSPPGTPPLSTPPPKKEIEEVGGEGEDLRHFELRGGNTAVDYEDMTELEKAVYLDGFYHRFFGIPPHRVKDFIVHHGEAVTSTYSPDAVLGDFTWKPAIPATQQVSLGFQGLKPPIPPPSETRTTPFKALEREKNRLQQEKEEEVVGDTIKQ